MHNVEAVAKKSIVNPFKNDGKPHVTLFPIEHWTMEDKTANLSDEEFWGQVYK